VNYIKSVGRIYTVHLAGKFFFESKKAIFFDLTDPIFKIYFLINFVKNIDTNVNKIIIVVDIVKFINKIKKIIANNTKNSKKKSNDPFKA
jgi:hypothetical protein